MNRMIALGLATVLATGATISSLAAAPIADVPDLQAVQVRDGGHGQRAARAYGYAYPNAYGYAYPNAWGYAYPNAYGYDAESFPFGNAYGYSGGAAAPYYGGSGNGYDCLGGRDGDGVPCGGY